MSGEKVYSKMKFESGVHRVQRVPKTESQGPGEEIQDQETIQQQEPQVQNHPDGRLRR